MNINQVDKSKRRTALHWAVASGNLDISLRLIQAGKLKHQKNTFQFIFRKLIVIVQKGAIVNSSDRELITPLMVASNEGHLSLVRMLIDHGADVNQTDRINYTALHYACIKRHNHIVYELLSAGAALPSSSWTICHPLKLLVVSESYALAKTLIESGSYHLNVEKWVATGNESKNKWFLDWLREYSKRPRSLKSLCRANTRARLGGVHLAHKVQLLDVPKHVQNFLLMK